jgi:hypothetical protein
MPHLLDTASYTITTAAEWLHERLIFGRRFRFRESPWERAFRIARPQVPEDGGDCFASKALVPMTMHLDGLLTHEFLQVLDFI